MVRQWDVSVTTSRAASWWSCSTYGQNYKCACLNRKAEMFHPGIPKTKPSGW